MQIHRMLYYIVTARLIVKYCIVLYCIVLPLAGDWKSFAPFSHLRSQQFGRKFQVYYFSHLLRPQLWPDHIAFIFQTRLCVAFRQDWTVSPQLQHYCLCKNGCHLGFRQDCTQHIGRIVCSIQARLYVAFRQDCMQHLSRIVCSIQAGLDRESRLNES